MSIRAQDFIDRYGRRVLSDGGQPGRDGNEGSGSTTEELQGRVAAAIYANCERLNDRQLDEIIGWIAQYKSSPSTWWVFEHEDGRQAVARSDAATFTHGEPKWHRAQPIEVHGAVDGAAGAPADREFKIGVVAPFDPQSLEAAAMHQEALELGADQALSGVQAVSAGFDDVPFTGCPEAWVEKPFAKIRWVRDGGDTSVGEPARAGWTLDVDQTGTVVADLAVLYSAGVAASDALLPSQRFTARLVDHTGEGTMTDGSVLWEVVAGDDERVGDCTDERAAHELARTLNVALVTWIAGDADDRTAG